MNGSTDSKTIDVTVTKQPTLGLAMASHDLLREVLREELRALEEDRDGTPPMGVIGVIDTLCDIADDLVTVSEAIGNPDSDDKERHEGAVRRLALQLMSVRAGLAEHHRLEKVARVTDRLAQLDAQVANDRPATGPHAGATGAARGRKAGAR